MAVLPVGGTIFLDEVGELPSRRIRATVRVIAATNRDLQSAINAGSFRSDLLYRLNVFPIEIPSLRERKEDIPLLVEYFIDRYARKVGKNITRVDKKTLELLQSYRWPGNMRELQNVIERSVIVCETANFSVDESWLSQNRLRREAGASFISRRWQLKKRKSSKQPCEKAKDGCSDRRVRPPNWGFHGPRWNRRFGHSKSTRIALGLCRKLDGSRSKVGSRGDF